MLRLIATSISRALPLRAPLQGQQLLFSSQRQLHTKYIKQSRAHQGRLMHKRVVESKLESVHEQLGHALRHTAQIEKVATDLKALKQQSRISNFFVVFMLGFIAYPCVPKKLIYYDCNT
jgi:hypothetical protein